VVVEITEGFLFPTASTRLMPAVKTQRLWKLQRDDDTHNPSRQDIPSRYDTCIVLADGVIGMDTKEMYLKNGHYVVNFPVSNCCSEYFIRYTDFCCWFLADADGVHRPFHSCP
jgi:hypothetical protein